MRIPTIALAALALGACTPADSTTKPPSAPTRAIAPASPAPRTADQYAAALKAKLPRIRLVIVLTEDNDSSNMLGRPNGFTSAAVLVDPQGEQCSHKKPRVECGAKIEVWPTADAAAARAKYVQDQLRQEPLLGTEYDYPAGPALLRVHGTVKPSVAKAYAGAWREVAG
jgi:hypothetical protein